LKYKQCSGNFYSNTINFAYFNVVPSLTNLNLYRESEAQTDPFSPEYVVEKENMPEILTIQHLKFNRGLPASMAEMELIE